MLPVLHWWLLLRAGRRIHETARNSFELLFHNHILINSLTQQRQAAVSAVAMKNRFLASAAHDMRQPVLALSLYADWLRNEPELVQEIAPKIVRATHAVNALFDSLFDLARIDSGQVRLHIERVDVAQLLHDLELQYRPVAEAKGLTFRVHVTPGTVLTDPIRVRRMIGNLLANAIKYTAEGGVLLASRQTRDGLRVEVWDTGIGIAREHLRDVFLEFYKVADHAGTSDGFGLGLAIVARLSHALGHPVSVRSRLGAAACSAWRCTTPTSRRRRPAFRARWADACAAGAPWPARSARRQQAVVARVVQRLRAALDAQAAEQAPQVHLDRVLADVELGGDVAVAHALVEHGDQLGLALRQLAVGGGHRLFGVGVGHQQAAQRGGEFGRAGRLLDVGVGAGFDAGFFHVGRRRGRIHRDRHVRIGLLDRHARPRRRWCRAASGRGRTGRARRAA